MAENATGEAGSGARPNRLPVTILTGFLGSGKTTVLNRLLSDPNLQDTAVIVNEFGEIGLDHLLVERALDEAVLLDNGCLCCSVRGDLIDTLGVLMQRVADGELPAFSRVMIETTGLADPGPIVTTLVTDPATADRFRLNGIVTTVDGVNGAETLAAQEEARAQAAMADLVLITKVDLADAVPARVRAAVRSFHPGVPILEIEDGRIAPERLTDLGATALSEEAPAAESDSAETNNGQTGHEHDGHGDGGHRHQAHDHDHAAPHAEIRSVAVVLDGPVSWDLLTGWLEWLSALRGPDILRIKGIAEVEGVSGPVVVHGVQHAFFPPRVLEDWPDDDHRTRFVIIARNVPEAALRASFERYREAATRRAA